MKDVIINDVHVGYRTNAQWHFESLMRFFDEQLLPSIKDHKYTNVWMIGDWFESRHSVGFNRIDESIELLERISKLIDGKIYMLVGNHDLYYKNNMMSHNFGSFKNIPKVEILLGNGCKEIDGNKLIYSSYDINNDNILNYLKENADEETVWFGHLETDGYQVIKYINENLKFGYSGHIHNMEDHKNFKYLPSTQQNKTDEVDSIHGYSVIDWDTGKIEMFDNEVSGRFVTIKFPTEVTSLDIKNNFIDVVIDKAEVRKLSNRRIHQDVLISDYKKMIDSLEPAIRFEPVTIDTDLENTNRKIMTESEILLTENDIMSNVSSIDDDIIEIVSVSEMMFAEETKSEIKEFMDNRGS